MFPLVLVVDDEPAIRESLAFALRREGLEVREAATLEAARGAAAGADLLVLDLMLPDGSGFDFLKELRQTSPIPVIVLTSRDDVTDRVLGLELGADDYVVKPFSPREVAARVKAVLRRARAPVPTPDAVLSGPGGLKLDRARRQASVRETPLVLSKTEFDLLSVLLGAPGRVFTRDQLLDAVWAGVVVGDRTVDAHVKALRRKVEEAGGDADLLEPGRGVGYRWAERDA